MNKIDIYFNYMAILIKSVLSFGKTSSKNFNSVLRDINCKQMIDISNIFPELSDRNRIPRHLDLIDITDNFFDRLTKICNEWDRWHKQLLIYYMDYAIVECYKRNVTFADDYVITSALNSNYNQTKIAIMKKIDCSWEHRLIGTSLQGILNNFYYVDYNNLDELDINNYLVDPSCLSFAQRETIKIAISPLTGDNVLRISEPYQKENLSTRAMQSYFRVEGINGENIIQSMVIENIIEAGKKDANLLVFPEMLGTENMLDTTLKKLKSLKGVKNIPDLIVFPSIWLKSIDDTCNTNSAAVIFKGKEIIFKQRKYGDFHYKDNQGQNIYEDINYTKCAKKEFNVLHIEGIGRICIIICYDLLEEDTRDKLIQNVYPTLVCCPSFSTGAFNFLILQEKYFSQNCNLVWCNTCSAKHIRGNIDNFEFVGAITLLSKDMDLGNTKNNYEGVKKCNKKVCNKCLYYADIPLSKKERSKI